MMNILITQPSENMDAQDLEDEMNRLLSKVEKEIKSVAVRKYDNHYKLFVYTV